MTKIDWHFCLASTVVLEYCKRLDCGVPRLDIDIEDVDPIVLGVFERDELEVDREMFPISRQVRLVWSVREGELAWRRLSECQRNMIILTGERPLSVQCPERVLILVS